MPETSDEPFELTERRAYHHRGVVHAFGEAVAARDRPDSGVRPENGGPPNLVLDAALLFHFIPTATILHLVEEREAIEREREALGV